VKQLVSPYALVLTGTSLENRLEARVSSVQFVDPHRLGPTLRPLHEHQVRDAEPLLGAAAAVVRSLRRDR
jgi:hypothetical protein